MTACRGGEFGLIWARLESWKVGIRGTHSWRSGRDGADERLAVALALLSAPVAGPSGVQRREDRVPRSAHVPGARRAGSRRAPHRRSPLQLVASTSGRPPPRLLGSVAPRPTRSASTCAKPLSVGVDGFQVPRPCADSRSCARCAPAIRVEGHLLPTWTRTRCVPDPFRWGHRIPRTWSVLGSGGF